MIKTLSIVLAAVLITVVVTGLFQQTNAQKTPTSPLNFTKIFKEKFVGEFTQFDVKVVYESPSTVVLEGDAITLQNNNPAGPTNTLIDNHHLWEAVDTVKQQGFVIDSVIISGLSTEDNPLVYHIVLSHK